MVPGPRRKALTGAEVLVGEFDPTATRVLREAIAAGTSEYGMQTFDQSLYYLYKKDLITLDEALRRASNPDEFKLKIAGIQSSSDMANEEMESTLGKGDEANPTEPGSPFIFSNQD